MQQILPSNNKSFGTPFHQMNYHKKYFSSIDRKTTELRDIVQFELVGALDQANKKLPARQVTRKDFAGVGTFINT